jgi:hypothetical protein
MKPASVYFGNPNEKHITLFAWLPIKTTSGKRVWLRKYVRIERLFDDTPRAPLRHLKWNTIMTYNEYLMHLLQGDKT